MSPRASKQRIITMLEGKHEEPLIEFENQFCSPANGVRKSSASNYCCSTAATSPAINTSSDSPWGTPWEEPSSPSWLQTTKHSQRMPVEKLIFIPPVALQRSWVLDGDELAVKYFSDFRLSAFFGSQPSSALPTEQGAVAPTAESWQSLLESLQQLSSKSAKRPETVPSSPRAQSKVDMSALEGHLPLCADIENDVREGMASEVASSQERFPKNINILSDAKARDEGQAGVLDTLFRTPCKQNRGPPISPDSPGALRKLSMTMSTMYQALLADSVEAVREVLAQDPDAAWNPLWEQNAEPPLCFASRLLRNPEIIQLLVNHNADVESVDCCGQTPLQLLRATAETRTYTEVPPSPFPCEDVSPSVFPLVGPFSARDRYQEIAGILSGVRAVNAPKSGMLEMAPQTPRKHNRCSMISPPTPGAPKKLSSFVSKMYQALRADSVEEVREALAQDSDAAWSPLWEQHAEPPLCFAARSLCDPRIFRCLLEHNADVQVVNRYGQTPFVLLRAAAEQGVDRRAPLDHMPWAEDTISEDISHEPFRSAQDRFQEIADILTGFGAVDVESAPQTPRRKSRCRDVSPIAPGAPSKRSFQVSEMYQALNADSLEKVREALARDRDAAWSPLWEQNAEPPLCFAARLFCDPGIFKILLEHSANVQAVNREGQTPLVLLQAAAEQGAHTKLPLCNMPCTQDAVSDDASLGAGIVGEVRFQEIANILTGAGVLNARESLVVEIAPQTPRKQTRCHETSPIAPGAPSKRSFPVSDMYKALRADSFEEVSKALAQNPSAAWSPLWEQRAEPPLCFAARWLCDPCIFRLLLEHKASVHAVNHQGQTPFVLLRAAAERGLCGEVPRFLAHCAQDTMSDNIWLEASISAEDRFHKIADILIGAGGIDIHESIVFGKPLQTRRMGTNCADTSPLSPRELEELQVATPSESNAFGAGFLGEIRPGFVRDSKLARSPSIAEGNVKVKVVDSPQSMVLHRTATEVGMYSKLPSFPSTDDELQCDFACGVPPLQNENYKIAPSSKMTMSTIPATEGN